MTLDDLYGLVLVNHPLAKQANLFSEMARQELRMARGYFDPKAQMDFDNKVFKDKNYYELWDSYLKIPTWFGVEFKAGHERNTGINLNPQSDTDSQGGLGYAGLSMPLGPISKGFLMDERRATLRKAQIGQDMAEAEKVKTINKLMLQIAKDYWQWYFHYHEYRLLENGYNLAKFRFESIKTRIQAGDLAGIDSVEAKITIQLREIDLRTAKMAWKNAGLILSNHLWDENGAPLEITDLVLPVQIPIFENTPELPKLFEFAQTNHPELQKLGFKLNQLDIDRRLAVEGLKPEIKLKYNFLATRPLNNNSFNDALLTQNYKFGLDFSVPLFLRKGRGKLGLTKAKLQQTTFELDFQRVNVLNQVASNYNDLQNLQELLVLQEDMVNNYRRMLSGEIQMFNNGASSVFYVNVREGKLLEAEVKLYSMRQKYAKAMAELLWSAGLNGQSDF